MIPALEKDFTGLAVRLCSLKCRFALELPFLTTLMKNKANPQIINAFPIIDFVLAFTFSLLKYFIILNILSIPLNKVINHLKITHLFWFFGFVCRFFVRVFFFHTEKEHYPTWLPSNSQLLLNVSFLTGYLPKSPCPSTAVSNASANFVAIYTECQQTLGNFQWLSPS